VKKVENKNKAKKEHLDEPDDRSSGSLDPMRLFLDDIGKHPLLDIEQQTLLAQKVAEGDSKAKAEMIAANLRLVIHWARRYQGRGVDLVDLVQEGTFGLVRAVEKFDWKRGFKFSTYATWWIRQSLQRAVQSKGRAIRLPEDAIAQEMATEKDGGEVQLRLPRVVASLDQPLGIDANATLGDIISDETSSMEDEISMTLSLKSLVDAIKRLPPLDQEVVKLRFGLEGKTPSSLENTAKTLGIGVRRVRSLEANALRFLAAQPEVSSLYSAA